MSQKKEENILNLESILFNCRDYLRGSASLNEKRDVILTFPKAVELLKHI